MFEVLYRYDPKTTVLKSMPETAGAALRKLIEGNQAFAKVLDRADAGLPSGRQVITLTAKDLGVTIKGDAAPEQLPFAAVLSCADARVPVEMVLWQQSNELFVVRIAGNVPGFQSMGSLDYAVQHLPSIKLLVVLGHTGCGAISAAADAYITPPSYMGITGDLSLRAVIDSTMLAVAGAAGALHEVYGYAVRKQPGYRSALIELSVIMNAALTAATVRQTFSSHLGPNLGVVYGVFNLQNHLIGLPGQDDAAGEWQAGLWDVPQGAGEFGALALEMARSSHIAQYLYGEVSVPAAGTAHSG
jgi:carbonic anhydrase